MTTEERKENEIDILMREWLPELCGPIGIGKYVYQTEDTESGEFHSVKFSLYTRDREYSIRGTVRGDGSGYLGCIVSARKSRAGEDWFRGNDLADGDFTRDTWDRILRDIVRYELRTISPRVTALLTATGHI